MSMPPIPTATTLSPRARRGLGSALAQRTLLPGRGTLLFVLSALCLVSAAWNLPARALPGDISTKFPVNDADPVKSIPTQEQRNQNPIEFAHFLQDLVSRAEGAFREHDWQQAVKYYEAVAIAVPDRAISFSRLCTAYGKLGQVDVGVANCAKALGLSGARVMDHIRFVDLTLQKRELTAENLADVEASLTHLREHVQATPQPPPPWDPEVIKRKAAEAKNPKRTVDPEQAKERLMRNHLALQLKKHQEQNGGAEAKAPEAAPEMVIHVPTEIELLTCRLAARQGDSERLSKCMDALRAFQLDDKLLFPFAWSKALIDKDGERAAALIEQAPGLGVTDETLASMVSEQEQVFVKARVLGLLKRWGLPALVLVVVLAGALVTARILRRRWRSPGPATQA